jgi:phage terminase large subunit-like protein
VVCAPGERGTVLVIAASQKQARVIFRYIRGLLTGVPLLARMIERETADTFDLDNGVSIEVGAASYRTVRGYTVVAALLDEIAFWPTDDAAEPDYEILAALRPGMATLPNAMLLCASSP